MKKISIFSTLLAGVMAFSACTDYSVDAVPPVSYDPVDSAQVAINITAKDFANAIDLATAGDTIVAMTIDMSETPALPEGSTMAFKSYIATAADMNDKSEITATVSGDNVLIATADLNSKIQTLFGKRPQPDTFYLQTIAFVTYPEGRVIELHSNIITATATPIATPIESAYYLIGDVNGWGLNTDYPFNHSGKDVYEDPIFTITVTVEGESYWKVAPQSAIDNQSWDTVLGNTEADGSTSAQGSLADNATAAGAMKFPEAGNYKVTLNMESYTYSVEVIPDVIEYFVVGDFSGWSQTNGQRLYSIGGAAAKGWIVLDGKGANGWKISTQENWDGTNYGAGEEAAAEAATMLLSTDGGAGNITQYSSFSYEVEFDAATPKLTILNTVSTWGVVGDATANGWDGPDVAMALSTEDGIDYLVATTDLKAGEFKFRANNDWAVNFGDSGAGDGTLARDGGNFKVSEAGTYEVRFYFCAEAPYHTITKK